MEQTLILLVMVVGLIGFMFWNQRRARRRYQQQTESLQPSDQIMTIGGIYGKLTAVDMQAKRARLEIAPGVEIQINLAAVSHRVSADEAIQ